MYCCHGKLIIHVVSVNMVNIFTIYYYFCIEIVPASGLDGKTSLTVFVWFLLLLPCSCWVSTSNKDHNTFLLSCIWFITH